MKTMSDKASIDRIKFEYDRLMRMAEDNLLVRALLVIERLSETDKSALAGIEAARVVSKTYRIAHAALSPSCSHAHEKWQAEIDLGFEAIKREMAQWKEKGASGQPEDRPPTSDRFGDEKGVTNDLGETALL